MRPDGRRRQSIPLDLIIRSFFGWHRDHRITAGVVLDCVYPIQWEQPEMVVAITETMPLKLKAVSCHTSQVGDFQAVEARVRRRAAPLGEAKGYLYAEGFDQVVMPG